MESAKSKEILILSCAAASLTAVHAIDDNTKYKILCSRVAVPGKNIFLITLITL